VRATSIAVRKLVLSPVRSMQGLVQRQCIHQVRVALEDLPQVAARPPGSVRNSEEQRWRPGHKRAALPVWASALTKAGLAPVRAQGQQLGRPRGGREINVVRAPRLCGEGLSYTEIAHRMRLSRSTVWARLNLPPDSGAVRR
jgi:hypothetical protein